jgi:1,4-alpha-glucan branching enzyme
MTAVVGAPELERLVSGAHHNPHAILGAHPTPEGTTVIRTLRPEAQAVAAVAGDTRVDLKRIHDAGVFEGVLPGALTDYRLVVEYGENTVTVDDPYRWLPTLGEIDLHLIGEGRHENLWQVLGAHVRSYDTPGGTVTGT